VIDRNIFLFSFAAEAGMLCSVRLISRRTLSGLSDDGCAGGDPGAKSEERGDQLELRIDE
jgi:hypothetical protein